MTSKRLPRIGVLVHKLTRDSGSTASAIDYFLALHEEELCPVLLLRKDAIGVAVNLSHDGSIVGIPVGRSAVPIGPSRGVPRSARALRSSSAPLLHTIWSTVRAFLNYVALRLEVGRRGLVVLNFIPGPVSEHLPKPLVRHVRGVGISHFHDPTPPLTGSDDRIHPTARQVALFQTERQATDYVRLGGELQPVLVRPTLDSTTQSQFGVPDGSRTAGAGPRFISVGSIGQRKNQLGIVRAFSQILGELPDAELVIVGGIKGGSEEDRAHERSLQAAVAAEGVGASVRLLGHRTDVKRLLHQSDVFVNFSFEEGLPRAMREAAAAGLPIIATFIPGATEFIEDGRSGFLVEPGNDDQLADRMLVLGRDDALRSDFSAAIMQRFRSDFSWAAFRDQVREVAYLLRDS